MAQPHTATEFLRQAGIDPSRLGYERATLLQSGFSGFVPFAQLLAGSAAPNESGVYVILYDCGPAVRFVHPSPAGWFKGKDPTCAETELQSNWLPGAPVVYVGKATSLRLRLRQFAKFGAGEAVGHQGGRIIWQLPKLDSLSVAWRVTPDHDPEAIEAALLRHFFSRFGKAPFANYPDRGGLLKRSRHCSD